MNLYLQTAAFIVKMWSSKDFFPFNGSFAPHLFFTYENINVSLKVRMRHCLHASIGPLHGVES